MKTARPTALIHCAKLAIAGLVASVFVTLVLAYTPVIGANSTIDGIELSWLAVQTAEAATPKAKSSGNFQYLTLTEKQASKAAERPTHTGAAYGLDYKYKNGDGKWATGKLSGIECPANCGAGAYIVATSKTLKKAVIPKQIDGKSVVCCKLGNGENALKEVDTRKATELKCLILQNLPVTALNVTKNAKLLALRATDGLFKKLDVSKNAQLISLQLVHCTNLTSIDVSKNAKLQSLGVPMCAIKELVVKKNGKLRDLNFVGNKVKTIDLSKNGELRTLLAGTLGDMYPVGSNPLTKLDVSCCPKLTALYCDGCGLDKLDLTKNTMLSVLWCKQNNLTYLNVSNCTKLDSIQCQSNKIKTLDVTKNTKLTHLHCTNNTLKSLDTTKNAKLDWLDCSYNNLTSLDVTKNTALTYLNCSNNKLKTLNISKNKKLKWLSTYGNNFDESSIYKNAESLTAAKVSSTLPQ